MKILLVEDSATIRFVMCRYIEEAGHTTIVAESGESALQILDTTPVDMVIMDVEMPGLNGFETTRLIREWMGDHWIPIIFVTGKGAAKSLEEGIEAGGDDYLTKPVNQIILNAKIRAMERITHMRNELAKVNEELTELSQRDGLTDLYNRRTFEQKAADLWHQAARSKTPLTLMLLDIDHFKLFNDCYGHPAGDECIRMVAGSLSATLNRSSDLLGRYGGEEFIAVLSNTHEEGARHICERIRKNVEELNIRHRDSSCSGVVTVSIGACTLPSGKGGDYDELVSLADQALYESKSEGRNRTTVRTFTGQKKLLLLDRDEDSLDTLQAELKGHFVVIGTSELRECAELAEEYRPDVIMTTANDGQSGITHLSDIANHPKMSELPLVVLVDNDAELKRRVKSLAERSALMTRPLDMDRLNSLLQSILT